MTKEKLYVKTYKYNFISETPQRYRNRRVKRWGFAWRHLAPCLKEFLKRVTRWNYSSEIPVGLPREWVDFPHSRQFERNPAETHIPRGRPDFQCFLSQLTHFKGDWTFLRMDSEPELTREADIIKTIMILVFPLAIVFIHFHWLVQYATGPIDSGSIAASVPRMRSATRGHVPVDTNNVGNGWSDSPCSST